MLKVFLGATQVKALYAEAEAAKSSLIAVAQPCNQSKEDNDKNDANDEDANDDNNDDGDHDAEDYVTVRSSSSCWCWCVMMMMMMTR